MEFKLGEQLVYPNHGVAVVEALEETPIGGQIWSCYRLRILASNALVMVPRQNADTVGLRPTITRSGVQDVLERLRVTPAAPNQNWKGRFKENSDRMRSGSLTDVADVLKSLSHLAGSRALSYREKLMLDRARELIVGELAAVQSETPEQVGATIDLALAHRGKTASA